MTFKRYECPGHPELTMFGKGGQKEFSGGVYITNDPVQQEDIESSDLFGLPDGINITGEEETQAALDKKITTILDDAPRTVDVYAHPDVEIAPDGSVVVHETIDHPGIVKDDVGKLRAVPRVGDSLSAIVNENALLDLTPEQRVKIAFLSAGFLEGTELEPIAQELGIDLDAIGTSAELADVVEEKLAPLIADRQRQRDPAAPPEPPGVAETPSEGLPIEGPDIPTRTLIRRGKQEELVVLANIHKVPDRHQWIGDLKEMRRALLRHFHDIEE